MLSRERVVETIMHRKPDRIPVYGWLRANLSAQISAAFGSVEAFEDKYEFDYAHLFGGPSPYDYQGLSAKYPGGVDPDVLLDIPMSDVNRSEAYDSLKKDIAFYKTARGRFVYVQTPGIFEALNGVLGIENHLVHLLLKETELREIYRRQADWNKAFANNCMDMGVDMIHVSDDWGAQNSLIFSPETWWSLIYPFHKVTADAVKQRGCFLSLHSDGNISSVLDGIIKLGFDVVHPYQESAGMNLTEFKQKYRGTFTAMGGLDVQTTIGFGKLDNLRSEIRRVVNMFRDGGLLFCTSHFVQDHCSMEELKVAFDTVYAEVRR